MVFVSRSQPLDIGHRYALWVLAATHTLMGCAVQRELSLADTQGSASAFAHARSVVGCTTTMEFAEHRRQGWGGRGLISGSIPPDGQVLDVRNGSPEVLELLRVDARGMEVRGLQAGRATLSVEWNGERHVLDLEVVSIASVTLTHPSDALLDEGDSAVFLAGSTADLDVILRAPDGGRVFGTCDPSALPMKLKGAAIARPVAGGVLSVSLAEPGRVEVRVGESRRILDVVAAEEIADVQVVVPEFGAEHLKPTLDDPFAELWHASYAKPLTAAVKATTHDGRVVVGLQDVRSATPQQCVISRSASPSARNIRGLGRPGYGFDPYTWDVRGTAPGECRVRVRAGDVEAGRTLRVR